MAARRPLIVGNWKMHGTRAGAEQLLSALKAQIAGADLADREVAVAPPFTALETAARVLAGSPLRLAAQNLHWEPRGAFTGEISGTMLTELGCTYVILGHSERRQYFGESDEQVARKTRAAQRDGLVPIVCVGETLEERERGAMLAVITRQVRGALQGQSKSALASLAVAYEPVWAIGTGRTATPAQAQEVHAALRAELAKAGAADLCLLYGGSVKAASAAALFAMADVDGGLVGGASLDADEFLAIARA